MERDQHLGHYQIARLGIRIDYRQGQRCGCYGQKDQCLYPCPYLRSLRYDDRTLLQYPALVLFVLVRSVPVRSVLARSVLEHSALVFARYLPDNLIGSRRRVSMNMVRSTRKENRSHVHQSYRKEAFYMSDRLYICVVVVCGVCWFLPQSHSRSL